MTETNKPGGFYTLDMSHLTGLIQVKMGSSGLRAAAKNIREKTGAAVSISTLSRVLSGKSPDTETLCRLCEWLKVHPGEMFTQGGDSLVVIVRDLVRRVETLEAKG